MSKVENTINFNGPGYQTLSLKKTQKQNGESFSNFTRLFLSPLLTFCTRNYFIWSSEYSNFNSFKVSGSATDHVTAFSEVQSRQI